MAGEAMAKVAELVRHAAGEAHAVDLLSQWAGFGRFCRDCLLLDALTVLRAFGLGEGDPTAEVRAAYPEARADEGQAAAAGRRWARAWERRFDPPAAPPGTG